MAVTWVATAVVSYVDTRHEIDELLDAHLAQSASLLVAQAGHDWDEIVEHAPQLHRYGRGVAFQFWENGSVLRLHSANAPNARLSAKTRASATPTSKAVRWRVFSAWDAKRRYLVQVGEQREAARRNRRDDGQEHARVRSLIALPALGLVIWFGINRATRPLQLLNRQVANRAPDNLASLQLAEAPAEVAPLVVEPESPVRAGSRPRWTTNADSPPMRRTSCARRSPRCARRRRWRAARSTTTSANARSTTSSPAATGHRI